LELMDDEHTGKEVKGNSYSLDLDIILAIA
jgi:hypothetical protein